VARHATRTHGFSLLELVMVLAVLGILASLAWPSLAEPVRQARRGEARQELMRVSTAQERWRSTHATYSSHVGQAGGLRLAPTDHALTYRSSGGLYDISLHVEPDTAAQSYTVQARAIGPMASDTRCAVYHLSMVDGVLSPSVEPAANASRCWGR
jgi:type IV pilus assembly protein PilE